FGVKLVGDCLRNFALYGEDVGQIAVVMLRPKVGVGSSINQLCAHTHTLPGSLHTSLEYMRDAKLLGDLAKVACCRILVLHHACAANHFQVSDLSEVGKDFILDTISEEGVRLIRAQVFKWEHRD